MDNSYNEITIPEIQTPDQSQGFNNAPIEDVQINVGNNRDISGMQYFAMDIWSSAWSAWDLTFRDIKLIWFNWDKEKSYTQEIITALWNTTAKITKSYTIDAPVSNIIKVPVWKVFKISAYFNTSTQTLRVSTTWSKRYLKWWNTDLTSTNTDLYFVNSWNSVINVTLKFATTASERPIFWFLIEIF